MAQSAALIKQQTNVASMFKLLDKPNCGRLSCSTTGDLLRSLGYDPTDEDMEQAVQEYGVDETEGFTLEDVLDLLFKIDNNIIATGKLTEAFRVLDKDGNGMIHVEELKEHMCSEGVPYTEKEFQDFISAAKVQG